jgi:hypothetical protein
MMISRSNNGQRLTSLIRSTFISGLVLSWVFAAYLQRGRFDQLFLFDAPDTPPVPGSFYPGPLGVHTFGDFLQPLWQSRLTPSPFITGYSSYLPATNGLFWLLSWIPYWTAFVLFVSVSLAALVYPFFNADRNVDLWGRMGVIVAGVLLTYPTLCALDRGNVQLLTIGLVAISIHHFKRENQPLAGISLGMAVALKAYPLLFVLLFIRRRHWQSIGYAAITAAVSTFIPLLLFNGGSERNVRALLTNLSSSQSELSRLALFTNNSLRGLSLTLQTTSFHNVGLFVERNVGLFVIVFLLVTLLISQTKRITNFEIAFLVASISTLSIGFSAGYVLLIFLVPSLFIFQNEVALDQAWINFYSVLIALILMPKQLPLHLFSDTYRQDGPSIAGLVNPLIMILSICAIAARITIEGLRDIFTRSMQPKY